MGATRRFEFRASSNCPVKTPLFENKGSGSSSKRRRRDRSWPFWRGSGRWMKIFTLIEDLAATIVRALRRYLATEGADILAVIEGREQIAAGEVHEMDDVLDEIERMIRSPAGEAA